MSIDTPGFLEAARLGKKTRFEYQQEAVAFEGFARKRKLRIKTAAALDAALVEYLEELFRADEGVHKARYAVFGVMHLRQWPTRDASLLPRSRAALQGWNRLVPDVSRDPLPYPLACLLARSLFASRRGLFQQAGRAVLVQFDTYLRPSEVVTLTLRNVVEPTKKAGKAYQRVALIIAPSSGLATTKAGKRDDSVIVGEGVADRRFVVDIVRQAAREARRRSASLDEPLFPGLTLQAYQQAIQEAAWASGLQALGVTPHMIRHGGPSTDAYEANRPLQEIQKRGRWEAAQSVSRYEKHGRLLRVLASVSDAVLTNAREACATISKQWK